MERYVWDGLANDCIPHGLWNDVFSHWGPGTPSPRLGGSCTP